MSGSRVWKGTLATLGLSLSILTPSFNSAVTNTAASAPQALGLPGTMSTMAISRTPANDFAVQPTTSPTRDELNQELLQTFRDTETYLASTLQDETFNGPDNSGLLDHIDKIKSLILAGADANLYVRNRINIPPDDNLTAFGAAIYLAILSHRPDLVETFLQRGADIHLRASDTWGPMDYARSAFIALQDFQTRSSSTLYNAARIIKILHDAGLRPEDATVGIPRQPQFQDYLDLDRGKNLITRHALYKNGLISEAAFNLAIEGNPDNSKDINHATVITNEFIQAHGGVVNDSYPDAFPGGPKPIIVVKGETLSSLAARFKKILGAKTVQEAMKAIAARNHIPLDPVTGKSRPLRKDETILIPISDKVEIGFAVVNVTLQKAGIHVTGDTILDLAKKYKPVYYNQNIEVSEIAIDIARMNGIDPANINRPNILQPNQKVAIGLINDTYSQFKPLIPPPSYQNNRQVDLLTIESPKDIDQGDNPTEDKSLIEYHVKNTFAVAAGTGYAINRQVNPARFHSIEDNVVDYPSPRSSNFLRMLMQAGNSPIRDRLVFSHSLAYFFRNITPAAVLAKTMDDAVSSENIMLLLDRLDKAKPTIFTGSGNYWPQEGRYVQSFADAHSPRTMLIGSAGRYKVATSLGGVENVVSPYTSYAADICAFLPPHLQKQREGTSFTTPLAASLYRQFNEWYGDKLSYEEIMAAAMMTARQRIRDYADPGAMKDDNGPEGENIKADPAKFSTNGGGLPHHDRCGAGVINVDLWQLSLDTMLSLKKPEQDSEGETFQISVGNAEVATTSALDQQKYTYRVTIPQDMTLGKLTFALLQNKANEHEIVIKTPAGFEMQLPKSINNIVSTFAFAYEDVKAGDFIEIHTDQPLGANAKVLLRGHAPGNAIALLRDHLRSRGILPAPLQDMSGDQVTGPTPPLSVLRDPPSPSS